MDRKSKILILIFILIVTASALVTYIRYVVAKEINYTTDYALFFESLEEDQMEAEEDTNINSASDSVNIEPIDNFE